MSIESAGVKTTSGVLALLAGLGITPEHAPIAFAITIGLVAGTLAAYPKERELRAQKRMTWWRWTCERLALWIALVMVVLALQEVAEGLGYAIEARLAGGLTMLFAYMGPDILLSLSRRATREIEDREAPPDGS